MMIAGMLRMLRVFFFVVLNYLGVFFLCVCVCVWVSDSLYCRDTLDLCCQYTAWCVFVHSVWPYRSPSVYFHKTAR